MATETIDTTTKEYERQYIRNLVNGVWYHLPLRDIDDMALPTSSSHVNLPFLHAYREISSDGKIAEVECIEDKQALTQLTQDFSEIKAMERFLGGPRTR